MLPMPDRPIDSPPMQIGVDFVVTLDGAVVDGVVAAHSTSDDTGCFGWVETASGVRYGCVEFRLLATA